MQCFLSTEEIGASTSPMKTLSIGCGLSALVLGAAFVRADALPLTKEEHARINRAIDEGAAYLKRAQGTHGTWAGPGEKYPVGYTALPGLTLLECGVPATDPAVRRAAAVVRRAVPNLEATYEIALSILFLDRLGDANDKERIQTLAVRLMAGQAETGGWTYRCGLVTKKDQHDILTALRQLDPPPLAGIPAKTGAALSGTAVTGKPPLLEGTTTAKPAESSPSDIPKLSKSAPSKPADLAPPQEKPPTLDPAALPRRLKALPVFQDPDPLSLREARGRQSVTDNSNTQFALLALWVAQRHDVPARCSLRLLVHRFETSQNPDGSWDYRYQYGGGESGEPAMTCVGLLGLAVGHGIAHAPLDKSDPKSVAGPRIRNGLAALAKSVGQPTGRWRDQPMENLYYLWSLERVGVLYGLPAVGGRDWYRWGAEVLVANQQKRGYWTNGGYHKASPTIDTCLALLFLQRANFIADLTAKLPFKPAELSQTITIQPVPSPGSTGGSVGPEKKP